MEMVLRTTLGLRIGRARTLLAVRDLADASARYRAACDRHEMTGRGASTMPGGRVYEVSGNAHRLVARVSWNGKVWPPGPWAPGQTPLYVPTSFAEAVRP